MAERPDGSQGRSREEDRHSRSAEGKRRETEKKVGKHKLNEVETTNVQVGEGTRSR